MTEISAIYGEVCKVDKSTIQITNARGHVCNHQYETINGLQCPPRTFYYTEDQEMCCCYPHDGDEVHPAIGWCLDPEMKTFENLILTNKCRKLMTKLKMKFKSRNKKLKFGFLWIWCLPLCKLWFTENCQFVLYKYQLEEYCWNDVIMDQQSSQSSQKQSWWFPLSNSITYID
jgi:hypothetical protein